MAKQLPTTLETPSDLRLLTCDDVARILNISRAFAYQQVQRGEIPCVRLGRAVRVRQEDLLIFIEQNLYSGSNLAHL